MSAADRAPVTAIIATFNRSRFLATSLDSVLQQSTPPEQVIVVDDGSTDVTPAVLSTYGERITVLTIANRGKPGAINAALPHATGRYIWVFDDDDIACDDALERHLAVLEQRPEVGFTYSGSYRCHADPRRGTLTIDGSYPVRPFADDEYFIEMLFSSYVGSPGVVVRSAIQRTAGPYREDLVRSQDLEMALRWGLLSRAGRLDHAEPTFYRREHPGPRGRATQRFDADSRVARARAYERSILLGLADTIQLRHYLPRTLWDADASDTLRARGLLRKCLVHIQKGLWAPAFEMLDQLRSAPLDSATVSADIASYGLRAFAYKPTVAELLAEPDALASLAAHFRHPALAPLSRCLQRQLYYHARSEASHGQFTELTITLKTAARLLGQRLPGKRRGSTSGTAR